MTDIETAIWARMDALESQLDALRQVLQSLKDAPTSRPITLCPRCNGQGVVSVPPGVSADQKTFVSSSPGPWPCRVCGGRGILYI